MRRRVKEEGQSITDRWVRGEVVATAGRELARQASAERPNNRFPAPCPNRCGTIVRRTTQADAEQAAREHAADRKACRKHPDR